ncbi:synaptic vesicle glycoprotein 2C-like [Prorops nasuta]|uniref:synaptic vesicle glycoprotein 2C-like n=1 Tax=Prorops nasuta TaxID=863751 RepID=UPI0034CF67AB
MIADKRNSEKISTITGDTEPQDGSADFFRAIAYSEYGRFNHLLLLAALPIVWTTTFDHTTTAFILSSAETDLELTFLRKGLLLAIPFIAMTISGFFWDFIADDYAGRRTLFVLGLLVDVFLNVLSSATQSYYALLSVKFISGVIIGGPLAKLSSYLTEFHSSKYKQRFSTRSSILFSVGIVVPPVIAMYVIPRHWSIDVFDLNYNSWRIYLLIFSIPPTLGLVTASLLPESPKQLMAAGRLDDALKLLGRIYSMNTGKPTDTFPIKALLGEHKAQLPKPWSKLCREKIRLSCYNTRLLLSPPYLSAFSRLCFLQFASMLGFNLMRLWVPHLFTILNNFDYENWKPEDREATICEMLDLRANVPSRDAWNSTDFDSFFIPWYESSAIYMRSTIIASSAVIFSSLFGLVAGTRIRKKIILLAAFLIMVVSSFGINWAQAPPYMLTLASAIIVTSRITGNIVTALNVAIIPIPLRTTSLAINNVIGNVAAALGNVIFAWLLSSDCLVSYAGLGCLFSGCVCLSFFLPKPVRTPPPDLTPGDLTGKKLHFSIYAP